MNEGGGDNGGESGPAAGYFAWGDGRPRVLQVVPSLEHTGGGVERSTLDIAHSLAECGATPLIASAGGRRVFELERIGAPHLEMPLASKNPFVIRANAGRLAQVIKKHGVDLVHARSRAPAWSAYMAARRTGTPFVTTFHGTYNFSGPVKRRYNSIMARGERVIANSRFIAHHMAANYGVESARIRVIPRGIDTEIFNPDRVSAERVIQLAQRWRLPDGVPVVMLPGRLTRWKGHALLIDALSRLGNVNLVCLFVGGDQGRERYSAELEELVHRAMLESVVQFCDHCDDMPAAYMLADVVVSASTDPEAFGRVVAEAQAMGRPVVISDHGGTREQIIGGETGWTFASGDAAALAQALEVALELDGTGRQRLAEAAIAHVRAHFTKQAMCNATLSVYNEVLVAAGGTA